MSVSSEARLGARTGRAQAGAQDGGEHRFLTRSMQRALQARRWAAAGDHHDRGHHWGLGLVTSAQCVGPDERSSRTRSHPLGHPCESRLRNR
jgi:hypothetical protein